MSMFVGNTNYDDDILCTITTSEDFILAYGKDYLNKSKNVLYYGQSLDIPKKLLEKPFSKWDMLGNNFIIITEKL